MMKFSYLATLEFITLSLIVTIIVAESSQEEKQLSMCKKIEVHLRKYRRKVTQVNVCNYNQDQYYISPASVVILSEYRKVNYHVFAKKYYKNLRMLVASKGILGQIAAKSEFRGKSVKFAKPTRIRFIDADQFHHVRKDVQIDDRWKTINNSLESDETFADMEISTNSLKTMSDFLAELSSIISTTEKRMELKSVIAEFEIPEYNEYIETLSQSVDVINFGPRIFGLIDMFDTETNQPSVMTIASHYQDYPKILENGWHLVQRRDTPGVDFNRTWNDYKYGFGNPDSDFWLGLDRLLRLTENNQYGLRLEFETHRGQEKSAKYKHFKVGHFKYQLNVSGFDNTSSALYDYLKFSNGHEFATVDDDTKDSCAKAFGGGWWMKPNEYHDCAPVHFNNELRSSMSHSRVCAHYHYFGSDDFNYYPDECLKRTRMFLLSKP